MPIAARQAATAKPMIINAIYPAEIDVSTAVVALTLTSVNEAPANVSDSTINL